jgi:hypothetical protein
LFTLTSLNDIIIGRNRLGGDLMAKSKKAEAAELKAVEETAKFLGERSQYLSPLVKQFMDIAVENMNKGFSGLDIAEALAVTCSSSILLYIPKEFEEKASS